MKRTLEAAEFCKAADVILDVRSPSEYRRGHIPGAISFPLFSDTERHQVGICYRQEGRDRAVEVGFAIVGIKIASFIRRATQLAPKRRLFLHCWRGGMRSQAITWALDLAGFEVTALEGGYKAFQHWGREVLSQSRTLHVIGGMTGTGKTAVLRALTAQGEQVLDLEKLANHRGSSYGSLGQPPQPTNEQFRNEIVWRWMGYQRQQTVWIEAESRQIGACRVPDELFAQMEQAPLVEITRSYSERLDLLVNDYGSLARADLIVATERLRKRLGGLLTQQAVQAIQLGQLREALALILTYYDKSYRYSLDRSGGNIYHYDATGLTSERLANQLMQLQIDADWPKK